MAAKQSSKTTKRLARDSDREWAAALAGMYRAGEITGDRLADWLEDFARDGTWDAWSVESMHKALRPQLCRFWFAHYRSKGLTADDAIDEVAEQLGCGTRTVRGHLYVKPKPDVT